MSQGKDPDKALRDQIKHYKTRWNSFSARFERSLSNLVTKRNVKLEGDIIQFVEKEKNPINPRGTFGLHNIDDIAELKRIRDEKQRKRRNK